MLAKSSMQFNGYEVNKISFDLSQDYAGGKEFQISPTFEIEIADCGDDKYKIQLSFSLNATEENPVPFNIEVIMTGRFSIRMDSEDAINEEFKKALLNENAVAIMFPFLRAIIASLTMNANIQPLILPVINLANSYKEKKLTE